jgi:hypothetical protein
MIVKGTNVIRRGDLPRKIHSAETKRAVNAAYAVVTSRRETSRGNGMRQTGLGFRSANWSEFQRGESSAEVFARSHKAAQLEHRSQIAALRARLIETTAEMMRANPALSSAEAALAASKEIVKLKSAVSPSALNAEKSVSVQDFHFSADFSAR